MRTRQRNTHVPLTRVASTHKPTYHPAPRAPAPHYMPAQRTQPCPPYDGHLPQVACKCAALSILQAHMYRNQGSISWQ